MKKSMHINESIPVTIIHVKENRKTEKKRKKKQGEKKFCVDTMIMLGIKLVFVASSLSTHH